MLVSILSYLKKKGLIAENGEPQPQDVLDAVASACKESGGYPVCARAAVTFKAATLLKMSCIDLAQYGPNKVNPVISKLHLVALVGARIAVVEGK